MRRVSSRQRLVSWDAFDAAATDEDSDFGSDEMNSVATTSDDGGYDTALENSNSCHDLLLLSSSNTHDPSLVGHKRDRSSHRAGHHHKGPSTSPAKLSPVSTTMPFRKTVQAASTLPAWSTPWEIDHTIVNDTDQCLKNSSSTSTLSSFISTSSTVSSSPFNSTTPPTTSADILNLNHLMKDMHIAIFAFLDVQSLQNIMAVNMPYRQLILSRDVQTCLWSQHCQGKWKVKKSNHDDSTLIRYLDRFHLPTAAAAPHITNLPLLLHMTPSSYPTSVDEVLVEAQNLRTERLRPLLQREGYPLPPLLRTPRQQQQPLQTIDCELRSYIDEKTGRRLVQYTGPIGAGDRCVRSDHPVPCPLRELDDQRQWHQQPKSRFLVNLLRRGANKMIVNNRSSSKQQQHSFSGKPFVVPFMENSTTVNVTPRFISYYEVSILDAIGTEVGTAGTTMAPAGQQTDCVAVGLATKFFPIHTRMPGWDRQSFGYHGDDGGIFHSSGGMVRKFGSKFGAGDTVGCGVDFVNKGIFFTLNGRFLGYAWIGIDDELLQNDLYPVVGLDSNCPLFLNFGADEPFQFDLSQFIMKHEWIVSSQYSLENLMEATPKLTRQLSVRSFSSSSSLNSLSSSFIRRGGPRERSV